MSPVVPMRGPLDGRSLARIWLAALAVLAAPAAVSILANQAPRVTAYFLLAHDLPMLALQSAALAAACLPAVRLGPRRVAWIEALAARRGGAICAGLALACAVVALAGWTLVYQRYPLSIDEMWADFDTRIFAHGRLVAPIAPAWRPFAAALQPQWRMRIAGGAAWASMYLPVNAGFRALAALAGSPALAGAAWAALSVGATWGLARRYWPDRPDAALVAALLLATSTQMLVAAMSPYAMSAHLALNLAWLWLFQRRGLTGQIGVASQAAAMGVAFLATGLHQLIFHPLFAAPFVIRLWMQRRWRLAAAHSAAYAAIVLFWAGYWPLMLGWLHLAPAAGADLGGADLPGHTLGLVRTALTPAGPLAMADNLLRFVAWQNPLTIVLALAGVGGSVWTRQRPDEGGRGGGALWPLTAGIALTLAAMLLLEPSQGYGWGYRYLHGLLGSASLLAAAAWVRLVRPGEASAERGWAVLGLTSVFVALVAAPIQFAQARALIAPFARAEAAIQGARVGDAIPAGVVIVDATGVWYGLDLVRNDPFLAQGPKVVALQALTEPGVRALCGQGRVALFDRADARRYGVLTFDTPPDARTLRLRTLLTQLGCVRAAG